MRVIGLMSGTSADGVDAALLEALGNTHGSLQIGIVSALGRRRHGPAVPALRELALAENDEIAHVALKALAEIGTPAAADAIRGSPADGVDAPARARACR